MNAASGSGNKSIKQTNETEIFLYGFVIGDHLFL